MSKHESHKRYVRFGVVLATCVLAVLSFAVTPVFADYEQVPEHFGSGGETEGLERPLGMAVNSNGVGLPGGETGSLYVVGEKNRVFRFALGKEGEVPAFREAWGWSVGNLKSEFQRCGPALETNETLHIFHTCTPPTSGFGGEEPGHFSGNGLAVDQKTGYVYVLNQRGEVRNHHLIEVFTATGTYVGGFGDAGRATPAPAESIDEGPEKLHQIAGTTASIAVDESGTVYVDDHDYSEVVDAHARVMSFQPCKPEEYENYCYTGQEHDITSEVAQPFFRIALAAGGELVTANRELIRTYPLGAEHPAPICSRPVSGQLRALAASTDTGEVFYFTFSGNSVHRLGPCDDLTGAYEELQSPVELAPVAKKVFALALDPALSWGGLRPRGVLYAGDEGNEIGDVLAPAKQLPPTIENESVANTTTGSATLRAKIDPNVFTTHYYFQYLSEADYLADGESFAGPVVPGVAPVVGEGTLDGSGTGIAAASVAGLVPDAAYRFRVIASSECDGAGEPACVTVGAPAAFRTYPLAAAGLPDGRAYELVSPVQKNGGEAFPADPGVSSCPAGCKPPAGGSFTITVDPMQSAPGGDAVAYMGYAFSSSEGAAVFNSYISRHTASGWQTAAMSPKLLLTKGAEDLAFDARLTSGTISQDNPQLSSTAPAGFPNVYVQNTSDLETLTPLLTSPPPNRGVENFVLEYAGYTPDFAGQFFKANDALTSASAFAPAPPDPGSTGRDLYEWRDGQLSLVNVAPGNSTVVAGASLVSASPDAHPISTDGQRVFWQTSSTVYVREDGHTTTEITHPGHFLTASADGQQVLLSDGCLYSLQTEACTDLTGGDGGFAGIVGQGEDLSHIYFVDTAALNGSGTNQYGAEAQAGKDNLYLYRSGEGTVFIATLATSDDDGSGAGNLTDWVSVAGARTAEASPDGRYLAFGSSNQLTGYDNVGPCTSAFNGTLDVYEIVQAPCAEVFLYDSVTGQLACASCNPTGEAPIGNSTLRRILFAREWQPQPRYVFDTGRLFFDSADRLSPLDVNGGVEDVYESEPAGTGSCTRSNGCVSLISPGTGTVDSNFLAADVGGEENGERRTAGSDVFFTTREQLVLADTDELIDVYDAREGGGLTSQAVTGQTECQGEACQPTPQPPVLQAPVSAVFNGPGNTTPVTSSVSTRSECPKGTTRKNGKCVKKPKARVKKRGRHSKSVKARKSVQRAVNAKGRAHQ